MAITLLGSLAGAVAGLLGVASPLVGMASPVVGMSSFFIPPVSSSLEFDVTSLVEGLLHTSSTSPDTNLPLEASSEVTGYSCNKGSEVTGYSCNKGS